MSQDHATIDSAARLSSYVPRLVSRRLATTTPLRAPEADTLQGAVLLTDIVGFTGHVERVSESGPGGLERFATALDAYFCALVEQVYAHGGDVVNIAGDAFLCLWTNGDEEAPFVAALRAVQAGRAIVEACASISGPGISFDTRVGVSAGDVVTAFVGGVEENWQLVTTGPAVEAVGAAEQAARPGTVCVTDATWSLLRAQCEGSPVDGGVVIERVITPISVVPTEQRAEVPDERLRPLLPRPVYRVPGGADTAWLAEMRHVTTVMASLSGMSHDNPASLELGHRSVELFQRSVNRFEGFGTIIVDNKGLTATAMFGLPPDAHEDDAVRAVRTAQAVVADLEALGVPCHAGVATGRAFCGAFGSDLRREYTVHGAVMNLASRLMTSTERGTLVDERVVAASRGVLTFEPVTPITVKGFAEPVQPSVPTGARQRVDHAAERIVGRGTELARLEDLVRSLHSSGEADVLVLEGEPGIGKSTLLADVAVRARARGIEVLSVTADSLETTTGYFSWRSAVEAVAQRNLLDQVIKDRPELARLRPLVGDVVPSLGSDSAYTAQMTGEVRAENTRRLLGAAFRTAGEVRPTLLLVEDAHWLDTSSWALLAEVASIAPKLAILATSRPVTGQAEVEERLHALWERPRGGHVLLEGLSVEQIDELVRSQLGIAAVPEQLAALVHERVAGNPFFCVELVRSLVESGGVHVVDGRADLRDLTSSQIPSTVEGVIVSRLDRLSPGQSLAVRTAAVIGRSFQLNTVRDVFPFADARAGVAADLEAVARTGLTVAEPAAEVTYQFSHEITREVAYGLLTEAQRRPVHLAVVDWYEQSPDGVDQSLSVLADHCAKGGAPARALGYSERAGQQALRTGAFANAKQFFGTSDELATQHEIEVEEQRRAAWVKGIGTADYFLGDLAASRIAYEQAVAMLDRRIPGSAVAYGGALLRAVARQTKHRVAPRRYFGRRARLQELINEAVDCYRVLGQIYFLDGEPPTKLIYLTMAGLNIGEEAGASIPLARILINAAVVTALANLNGLADRYALRALEMVEADGLGDASSYVWSINALLHANRGDFAKARESNDRALKQVFEVGDYNLEAEVWQTRGALEVCAGE
ncbi:MAG TPA: AAA family ATPase, partial [Acidimicrobiales bacterium]